MSDTEQQRQRRKSRRRKKRKFSANHEIVKKGSTFIQLPGLVLEISTILYLQTRKKTQQIVQHVYDYFSKSQDQATTNEWEEVKRKKLGKKAIEEKNGYYVSYNEKAQSFTLENYNSTQYYENRHQAVNYLYAVSLKPSALDLHNFTRRESLEALDMFLDSIITNLMENKQKIVKVITGKGNRSVDKKSKIQPNIEKRLKQRKLEFTLHAGYFQVELNSDSLLTTEIKNSN